MHVASQVLLTEASQNLMHFSPDLYFTNRIAIYALSVEVQNQTGLSQTDMAQLQRITQTVKVNPFVMIPVWSSGASGNNTCKKLAPNLSDYL